MSAIQYAVRIVFRNEDDCTRAIEFVGDDALSRLDDECEVIWLTKCHVTEVAVILGIQKMAKDLGLCTRDIEEAEYWRVSERTSLRLCFPLDKPEPPVSSSAS